MSFDMCRTCRCVGYCTFPRKRVITECDEFEDMDTAPEHEWDLRELLKLWPASEERTEAG